MHFQLSETNMRNRKASTKQNTESRLDQRKFRNLGTNEMDNEFCWDSVYNLQQNNIIMIHTYYSVSSTSINDDLIKIELTRLEVRC